MSGTVFAENEVREEVIGEPLRAPETVLPYKPKLPDEQSEEFYAAVYAAYEAGFPVNAQSTERQVARLDAAAQRAIVQRQGAKRRGDKQKADDVAFLIAALLLLRDLLQIGWTLAIQGTEIRLHRKALSDDKAEAKQQIRQSMMFERKESMNGASVRSFIRDMEKVRHHNGQDVSVLSLVADGIQLHTGLTEAAALPEAERLIRLKETVKPYLHLVEGDLRDPFTNLRLIDIWRYFRLTWSTPYRPTPGRNVFYLVRDAGQPNHPVIGIAALANVIIGIRCRDDRIGWTTEALAARLAEAKTRDTELVGQGKPDEAQNFDNTCWQGMLETHLEKGLSLIDISGITTRNEVTYPTSEGVAAIWKIADDATEARYQHLKDEAVLDNFDPEEFELELQGNIPAKKAREQRDSSAALFLRKRAEKFCKKMYLRMRLRVCRS
jgi:hypothetical protein